MLASLTEAHLARGGGVPAETAASSVSGPAVSKPLGFAAPWTKPAWSTPCAQPPSEALRPWRMNKGISGFMGITPVLEQAQTFLVSLRNSFLSRVCASCLR